MISEHTTPEFKVEKTPSGRPYLSMAYEPTLNYKIFNGLTFFTFDLRRDIPFEKVYALQEMLQEYVEGVTVQD